MTPSHDLYDLIHSLTAAEKRYVRRTALVSGRDTSWLRLFDAIDSQREFNEESLRTLLPGDPMLTNLSVAKRYAYQTILRALKSYGTGRDFDSQIGEAIESYKVLIHKGLTKQAARLLRDIKQRAVAGDAYLRLYWANVQDYVMAVNSTEQASMDQLQRANIDRQEILRCIQNYSLVGDIYFRQRVFLRHRPNARSRAEQEELREIVAPLLVMMDEELLTPTASSLCYTALGDYWEAVGRPDLARPYFDRFLDPARLDLQIGTTDSLHIGVFTNALFFRLRQRMTEGLQIYVDALEKKIGCVDRQGRLLPKQIWFYERWLLTSLMLMNLTGRFDEATRLLRTEQERMDRFWNVMSKKMRLQLLHTIAAVNLARGEHSAAIETLNRLLNDSEASTEEYGAAKLLAIVAHVEAGNTEWLDAAFRSTSRYLTLHERYHRTEKTMITGLHRVLAAQNEREERAAFLRLHNQLEGLFNDPRERTVAASFDLLSWTKAHATGIPFVQLATDEH